MFATSTLRYYAGCADKIHGKTIPAGIFFSGSFKRNAFNIIFSNVNLFY